MRERARDLRELDLPLVRIPSTDVPACPAPTWVVALVYELLDAHDDTARMVAESASEQAWEAHLDYLRALQRRSRQLLAGSASTT
jgi:hypothetical protein